MKNVMPQLSIAIIALVAFTLLMSYSHPVAEEAKQYIVIRQVLVKGWDTKLAEQVDGKLAEGWHTTGGITILGGEVAQPMVKYFGCRTVYNISS